jgi:aryl-alcohol dehydrogenase-like predicted oxidoreductase
MKYRLIGNTGIRVSEVGLGTWALGGPVDVFGIPVGWGVVDDNESKATIDRAYDLGVNFFDTSNIYGNGHSEELLGECLTGKDCVIATKVGIARTATESIKDFSTKHIREAIEASLRRLKRERVDLYQLHNPPPEVWQGNEVFDLLADLKREGKIRASGVSTSTAEEGIHLCEKKKVDSLQILLNIFQQEPAEKLLDIAKKNGVGIVVRVPLASGLLTGKFKPAHRFARDDNRSNYMNEQRMQEALSKVDRLKEMTVATGFTLPQIALAFLLKFDAISSVIPGAKNINQVQQNVSASDLELSTQLFESIRKEFADYNFYKRYRVRV